MLFRNKDRSEAKSKEKAIILEDQEVQEIEVQEQLSTLGERDKKETVAEADAQVDSAVKEAARDSLRSLRLLEEGRCPECGRKSTQFLFTSICAHCGWSTFIKPRLSVVRVHLTGGETVECDSTFDTKSGDLLCIHEDVVRFRLAKQNVRYIEYAWTDEEIRVRREERMRQVVGVCDWCVQALPTDRDDVWETYAAIGAQQERFRFCTEKCLRSFEKQYPARIHRDCYNRDCRTCEECIKRFDDTSAKRLPVYGEQR
jgi:hypothetical protein